MRAAWVDKHPNAAQALLMAVMEAQQWCDKPENHEELAAIMRQAPVDQRARSRTSSTAPRASSTTAPASVVENIPHIMKYWRDHASYPFQSHDLWFITEDIRWGKFEPTVDAKALIEKVNREDIWREAAKAARRCRPTEIPASTSRGKETFFDGKVFDPDNPTRLPQEPCRSSASRSERRAVRAGGAIIRRPRNEHAGDQDRAAVGAAPRDAPTVLRSSCQAPIARRARCWRAAPATSRRASCRRSSSSR